MDAPPHHRKIDLQSPSDLTHLITVIKSSAREKIDRDIPKSPAVNEGNRDGREGEDGFRQKVENIVENVRLYPLSLRRGRGTVPQPRNQSVLIIPIVHQSDPHPSPALDKYQRL